MTQLKTHIYFDNNSTTRLDDDVLDAMLPYFTSEYGNPASQHHFGLEIRNFVEQAREITLKLINAVNCDLVFTSGATEGINIALKGVAFGAPNGRNKIVTAATEHQAVLDTCSYLEQIGFEIIWLPVNREGIVILQDASKLINQETLAVCLMLVNNETGVIQPIRELSQICHDNGAIMVCDATQAVGKIKVDSVDLGADIIVFSSHKFHGPKGIGGLILRKGLNLSPLIHGGGHEYGLRSGTLNVAGIAGLVKALDIAVNELEQHTEHIKQIRDSLEKQLLAIPCTTLNGDPELRAPNVVNISFPYIDANTFISEVKQLAVSNGSACTSSVFEPSHVLKAMGVDNQSAFGALRFSLSKYNTQDEVNEVAALIRHYLKRFISNR